MPYVKVQMPKRWGHRISQTEKLEAELRRKERSLVETAAILVLRGKAEAIWGENEVD